MNELVGVRLADEDFLMIKAFAENGTPKRTVAQVIRQLVHRGIAEGEIDTGDLPAPSATELLQRRRKRTLAEDVAVMQAGYDHLIDEMCTIAGRSLRDAVLLTAGIGSALRTSASQLAEQNGTTIEALMGEEN